MGSAPERDSFLMPRRSGSRLVASARGFVGWGAWFYCFRVCFNWQDIHNSIWSSLVIWNMVILFSAWENTKKSLFSMLVSIIGFVCPFLANRNMSEIGDCLFDIIIDRWKSSRRRSVKRKHTFSRVPSHWRSTARNSACWLVSTCILVLISCKKGRNVTRGGKKCVNAL